MMMSLVNFSPPVPIITWRLTRTLCFISFGLFPATALILSRAISLVSLCLIKVFFIPIFSLSVATKRNVYRKIRKFLNCLLIQFWTQQSCIEFLKKLLKPATYSYRCLAMADISMYHTKAAMVQQCLIMVTAGKFQVTLKAKYSERVQNWYPASSIRFVSPLFIFVIVPLGGALLTNL